MGSIRLFIALLKLIRRQFTKKEVVSYVAVKLECKKLELTRQVSQMLSCLNVRLRTCFDTGHCKRSLVGTKKGFKFNTHPKSIFVFSCFTTCPKSPLSDLQGCLCPDKAAKDEHGEEDHGAAEAGGVQPPGQCAGPDAPATPLL